MAGNRRYVREFQRSVRAVIGHPRPGVAALAGSVSDARGAAEGSGEPPVPPGTGGSGRFRFVMGHPVLGSIPADGEPWPWEL